MMIIQSCSKDRFGRYMTKGLLRVMCLPDRKPPREYYKLTTIDDDQMTYTEVILSGDKINSSKKATCCHVGLIVGCINNNLYRHKSTYVSWYRSNLTLASASEWAEVLADLVHNNRLIEAIAFCVNNDFTYDHY